MDEFFDFGPFLPSPEALEPIDALGMQQPDYTEQDFIFSERYYSSDEMVPEGNTLGADAHAPLP